MAASADLDMLRPIDDPFQDYGGLRLMKGNLGRAVIELSAVKPEQHRPAGNSAEAPSQR